jgi:hypothetical protein
MEGREGGREGGRARWHTCIGHESSSPDSIHLQPKVPGADTHPCPLELVHRADGREGGSDVGNGGEVCFDGPLAFVDLGEEVGACGRGSEGGREGGRVG